MTVIPLLKTTPLVISKCKTLFRNMHRQLDKNLPEIKLLLSNEVVFLCNMFLTKGYEIRIVGGAVRDMLMKRKAKDIDLSTTATPEEMISVFKENNVRYIETGLQHGTLTAHMNENDYEVTTLRIDVETYGRKAKVEFTHDWRLDALRRDLTVNAMSLDMNAMLYDYFDGEKDLTDGKIRFVGNPNERIREDYLRILRYFRFYGRIAPDTLHHDDVTLKIIKNLTGGINQVAVERIWLEFNRILTGNFAPHLLRLIYELEVGQNIGLPTVSEKKLKEFEKVWSHTHNLNPNPITLLVTLVESESEAEKLCLAWKLSSFEKNLACFVAAHRYQSNLSSLPIKFYQDILVRKSNPKNLSVIRSQVSELLKYEGKQAELLEIQTWDIATFPLSGTDLKQHGVKPGPLMGKVLNELKNKWIDSYYTLSRDVLLNEIKKVHESFKTSNQ